MVEVDEVVENLEQRKAAAGRVSNPRVRESTGGGGSKRRRRKRAFPKSPDRSLPQHQGTSWRGRESQNVTSEFERLAQKQNKKSKIKTINMKTKKNVNENLLLRQVGATVIFILNTFSESQIFY